MAYKKGAITILLLDAGAIAELMIDRGIGVVKQPCTCTKSMPSSLISTSLTTEGDYTALHQICHAPPGLLP